MSAPPNLWISSFSSAIDTVKNNLFHNNTLEYVTHGGWFGIPIATYGMTAIVLSVFAYATFQEEAENASKAIAETSEEWMRSASDSVEQVKERVSETTDSFSSSSSIKMGGGGSKNRKKNKRKNCSTRRK